MPTAAKEFYEKCNLTSNPFRPNPALVSDPRADIWAGYEKERRQLTKYMERTRLDQIGSINFLMVYGDYGTGKSHALLWARYQITEKYKEQYQSVVYYIQTLRTGAKFSFAGAYLSDIVSKSNIAMDLLSCKQFLQEAVIKYKQHNGLGPEKDDLACLTKMIPAVEIMNFVAGLLDCTSKDDVRNLIAPKGLSDYGAMKMLTTIINLFVLRLTPAEDEVSFKLGAYLFVDEVDLLGTAPAKEAREANELFRHIYDNCPTAFCFVLGFTATAAELPVLFAEYVLSRVTKQIILEHMEVDEAKEFVMKVLDRERHDSDNNVGYFPFTEEAIQGVVSKIVSITPRKIVMHMHDLLEECRLIGADPSDGEITLEFLDDNDILEEVMG